MDITKMSITELKALLFDLDQNIKKLQNDYSVVGAEFQKKIDEEKKQAISVVNKVKEIGKEKGKKGKKK